MFRSKGIYENQLPTKRSLLINQKGLLPILHEKRTTNLDDDVSAFHMTVDYYSITSIPETDSIYPCIVALSGQTRVAGPPTHLNAVNKRHVI